jgi:starch synthase
VALNQAGLDWQPDIVHCNDWQSGLVPALLSAVTPRPATVFTIHNLAYQGLFPAEQFQRLGLPESLWGMDGLEFYGQLSFIKGGLKYADMLSTVSPTYAKEICTPELGSGLDGLLLSRTDRLVGVLNGADYSEWDPGHDTHLPHHYGPDTLQGKAANKAALQRELGLQRDPRVPLIGFIGRLVEQKGVDLLMAVLGNLLEQNTQTVILGSGNKDFEKALTTLAAHYPRRCHVRIGFNETLAHRIEAAADTFLMPSRYEPCGLNQLYSLRYGTPPVVRRTGGLADTVIDISAGLDVATGFVFDEPSPAALLSSVRQAVTLYKDNPEAWHKLMRNGMVRDYGWPQSAKIYLDIYRQALARRGQANAQ